MLQDKQLSGVNLQEVLEKRRLDQPQNAKEFAVLGGISYSTACECFRLPRFPVFRGVAFWRDFVKWRRAQAGLNQRASDQPAQTRPTKVAAKDLDLRPKAARILGEACSGYSRSLATDQCEGRLTLRSARA